MKFTADAKELRRTLAALRKVRPGRRALPVMQGIHIEVADEVHFTASDESLTIRTTIPGAVEDGVAVIHGRLLADVLKVANGPVTVSVEEKTVVVSDADGRWEVEAWLPVEDFPTPPPLPTRWSKLPEDFASGLAQVLPATSSSALRPILTNVYFDSEDGRLRLVATDSYRLVIRDFEHPFKKPVLVPQSVLTAAAKATKVRYAAKTPYVTIDADGVAYTARVTEGQFPTYRHFFPDPAPQTTVDRAEVLAALKRLRPLCTENSLVRLDFANPSLSVDNERGRAKVRLTYPPAPVATMAFNPHFLADGVQACSDEIAVTLTGSLKPALFSAGAFRYCLMPIRVD